LQIAKPLQSISELAKGAAGNPGEGKKLSVVGMA
jgi:hypothetical protein